MEAIPPEVPGDMFDRQRRVPGWDHAVIEKQVALVLGAGGIGSTVSMALCRLGVRKVFLVDMDCVEASNLNRQILFRPEDVGRNKVDAAADSLRRSHCLQTEVVPLHMDAITNWSKIVECAKESTAIFNAIDHGDAFDFAATSLAFALHIPYSTGASYAHTAIAESFSPNKESPCWACNNHLREDIAEQLTPDRILAYDNIDFIRVLKKVEVSARAVGSSVLPCSIASQMTVTAWINRMFGMDTPNWSCLLLTDFSTTTFAVEKNPACLVCTKEC